MVGRQLLIDSRFSAVICAPVYSSHASLSTRVPVGVEEGLKHDSSTHCDELIRLPKSMLTDFVGTLASDLMRRVDLALAIAFELC